MNFCLDLLHRYFLLSLNVTNILSFLIWYKNSYTSIEHRIQYKQQYIYLLGINHNSFRVCLLFVYSSLSHRTLFSKIIYTIKNHKSISKEWYCSMYYLFFKKYIVRNHWLDTFHSPLHHLVMKRGTNRNQPRVSNNSTKTVKKQKRWMFNVARKKWTFSVPRNKSLTDTYYMSGALWSSESGHWSPVIPGDTPLNSLPWERLVFCQGITELIKTHIKYMY